MPAAYIGIGSNIEPEANIQAALRLLAALVRVKAISTFYLTAPMGPPGSPAFYNGVAEVSTDLAPRQLKFGVLRAIEQSLGRTRGADRCVPRTIDLDITSYDDLVIREPDLTIPDPDIRTRAFLAVPLLELAPELVLPDSKQRLEDIVRSLPGELAEPLPEFTRALRQEILNEP